MSDPRPTARWLAHEYLWSFCHRDRMLGEHHAMCDELTATIEADRAASDTREDRLREAMSVQLGMWESLAADVEAARLHAENRGGQHAGIPSMICASPSIRQQLASLSRNALEYGRAALAAISPRSDR